MSGWHLDKETGSEARSEAAHAKKGGHVSDHPFSGVD